jgi:hypothetical protein
MEVLVIVNIGFFIVTMLLLDLMEWRIQKKIRRIEKILDVVVCTTDSSWANMTKTNKERK